MKTNGINGIPKMGKEEADTMVMDEDSFKTFYWLSCSPDLLQMGFTKNEIQNAINKAGLSVDDLTDKKDFVNGCDHKKAQLLKDFHTSNYIRVYEDLMVEGQYVPMEGYKTGQVQTFQIESEYQGTIHTKVLRALFQKNFKWFNRFNWSIYELRGFDYAEFYLETEHGSLYIPVMALLNRDFSLIKKRQTEYYTFYRKDSNYELNKQKGETIAGFKIRKKEEFLKDCKPLQSKEAKRLIKYLNQNGN